MQTLCSVTNHSAHDVRPKVTRGVGGIAGLHPESAKDGEKDGHGDEMRLG